MNNCNECGLCKFSEPNCIKGSGSRDSDIMVVNSYASDLDEDKEQATMEDIVKSQFRQAKLDLDNIYYTNAVKCRTPKGYKIKVSEVKKCKQHLHDEIKRIKPKFVLLMGAQAVQAALDMKITEILGTVQEVDGVKYMATYSPRVIHYDVSKAPQVIKDLESFKSLTRGIKVGKKAKLNVNIITNMKEAQEAIKYYKKNYKSVSYDIETTGLNRYKEKVNLIGFGNDKIQYIFPVEARFGPMEKKPIARRKIAEYLIESIDEIKNKIGANVKFDNLFLREHFGDSPSPTFDIVLASHLLNENTPNGLKENAIFEFSAPNWDIDIDLKKGKIKSPAKLEEYYTYLGYDIYYTHKLYKRFLKKLKADRCLYNIYYHITMPAARAYEDIEELGVYVYPERFKALEVELRDKQNGIISKMYESLPKKMRSKDINWNSDHQLRDILYNHLKLPIIEKTDTGAPSTSESVLMRLSNKHPLVGLILEYRGVSIQISHFIEGWKSRMYNGRLHPSFLLHGTVTGRTSCKNPNLQQVPRDKAIRSLIGAPEGWTFIESDYSQIELRGVAEISGDTTMKRLFQQGIDIHTNTGKAVSGQDELSYEDRKKAKAVNFGFVYGMSWRKFKDYARDSYEVHLTDQEAKEYREKFFQTYHELPEWHARQKKIVNYLGEVRGPIGRIRRLPDIFSKDQGKRAEAERQSINSPVQGFGSDLCVMSMAEAHNTFPRSKARCVGTVHDAQLWEVRNDYVEDFCKKLKRIMESPTALSKVFKFEPSVPIVTDVEVGNWGLGQELENWVKEHSEYKQRKFKK